VKHLGFSGFGSMEFLVDGDRVYLIDAVARLNAAFPLWEELLRIRTVEWQLAGLGELPAPSPRLKDRPPTAYGAGISLRFYAEDPIRQIPCPGLIRELTDPFRRKDAESSVIWMTRYRSGQEVKWTSSGVVGELFVLGKDRKATLASARAELRRLWIAGTVRTNQRFLLEHLEHPFVKENLIHAGFTDEDFVPEAFPPEKTLGEVAALAASLFPLENARWVVGSRWVTPDPTLMGRWREEVARSGRFASMGFEGAHGEISDKGRNPRFHFEPTHEDRWLATFDTWTLAVRRVSPQELARTPEKQKTRKILALAPGRVHALLRHPGEALAAHDRACMIESLGILVPHAIPVPARLLEWKVAPGEIVEAGRELAVLELLG
jgi:acetyl/propionyl-CoA carboxylase alpha subunit